MKNIMSFIKDKIYYFMGGTIVVFVLLIVIGSCSNKSAGGTYEKIEQNMVNAATKYYESRKDHLPKVDGGVVKVTISTLNDAELLNEVVDPSDSSKTCSGYVEVTKVGNEYSYIPFLTCKGSYEPKYLTDKIKNVKTDEYGNGVYTINSELVYKGDDVDNYVSFNNQLWRIVKVDATGDIKLVLSRRLDDSYSWDSAYNSDKKSNVGITTDYLHTDIRKSLDEYYKTNFTKESKAKIISKNLCVGKYSEEDVFSSEKECSIIKENEKIGLLNVSDIQNASLDTKCLNITSNECSNYNYLSNDDINTWLLNSDSDTTHKVYSLSGSIYLSTASNSKKINPVIYITGKSLTTKGDGTLENPYVIK